FGIVSTLCLGLTARLAMADDHRDHHSLYLQTNLVSDIPGAAAVTDPNLVNPWGLSRSATSPWWVADNGSGLSTLYNGAGAIQALVVTLPNAPGATGPSGPTGTVFNGVATDFLVAPGKPAHFIFDSENGIISAWNSGPAAAIVVDNSATAVYKGMTLAQNNGVTLLYTADFETGKVDVFDTNFAPVDLGAGAFQDERLPANYTPFNVQSIGSSIYVTFAERQGNSIINEQDGTGLGRVDVFSPAGVLQMRLRHGPWFNAPWGVVLAPANFGEASNRILVGNFGSGLIAMFDPANGEFRGFLRGTTGFPLAIDRLWALAFGNGASAGPATTLFFSAGIFDENHGLFGTITPLPSSGGGDDDEDDASAQP
ncbi:MAG: TIGR03118 family protein, partial [Opitutaceae bacterium]